nr:methylated-DNA--[protein]-cysteine S-methyltransferase [Legionella septentrionalis]
MYTLYYCEIPTVLGTMLAVADESFLHLLEFVDCTDLSDKIRRLQQQTRSKLVFGMTSPLLAIQQELSAYFSGELRVFKTPFLLAGSDFQNMVWQVLYSIPYGTLKSYSELAFMLERPKAYRAVAHANATNQIAILIPCHRIVRNNGQLAGYNGGIKRKAWLIAHEQKTGSGGSSNRN